MRKAFKHLTIYDRDRLEALWNSGEEKQTIAKILGVHKSTVSREIETRQMTDGRYRATMANHKALIRRSNSKYQGMKIEAHPWLKQHIVRELKRSQAPEGIAGRMSEEKWPIRVSSDAIYRWLRSVYGQSYCQYLCTKRWYPKPQTGNPKRHIIPNLVSIHNLSSNPGVVAEGDTFLSPKKVSKASAVLVGWQESKLLKGNLVKSLRPKHTTRVIKQVKTEYEVDALIMDQGIENIEHEQFGVVTYFCDPASPRQKPFIESSIGLCRRWFWPKGTNLAKISKEEFQEKLEILNNKYRKSLGYRTANEVARECGIFKNY
ncbi:MAG: IS30 family transposase [Patescibacteria group bacterium]